MVLIIKKHEPKVAFQFKKGEQFPKEFQPFFDNGQLVRNENFIEIHTRTNVKKGRTDIFQKLEENDWLFIPHHNSTCLVKLTQEEFEAEYQMF